MNNVTEKHRQLGMITSAKEANWRGEDGPPNTVWVYLDFDGSGQGFGGLALQDNKGRQAYISQLCATFGVSTLDQLAGKKCYALRSFSGWGGTIEGLESVDTGTRFTFTNYRRSRGYDAPSPLDEALKGVLSDVLRAQKVLREAEARVAELKADYVEW